MNELIITLSYEDNPLHIFSYNGKTAFLAKEVADIGRTINISRKKTHQDKEPVKTT